MDDLNTDRALECVHHVFPGVESDDPLVQREDGLVARPHPANLKHLYSVSGQISTSVSGALSSICPDIRILGGYQFSVGY